MGPANLVERVVVPGIGGEEVRSGQGRGSCWGAQIFFFLLGPPPHPSQAWGVEKQPGSGVRTQRRKRAIAKTPRKKDGERLAVLPGPQPVPCGRWPAPLAWSVCITVLGVGEERVAC